MTFVAGPFVIALITGAWVVAVLAACTFLAPSLGFDRSSIFAVGAATFVAGGVWDTLSVAPPPLLPASSWSVAAAVAGIRRTSTRRTCPLRSSA